MIMKTVKFEVMCENEQFVDCWAVAIRNNVTFEVIPEKERSLKPVKFKPGSKTTKKF